MVRNLSFAIVIIIGIGSLLAGVGLCWYPSAWMIDPSHIKFLAIAAGTCCLLSSIMLYRMENRQENLVGSMESEHHDSVDPIETKPKPEIGPIEKKGGMQC